MAKGPSLMTQGLRLSVFVLLKCLAARRYFLRRLGREWVKRKHDDSAPELASRFAINAILTGAGIGAAASAPRRCIGPRGVRPLIDLGEACG